jgi:nitroreductase
MDVLECIRNRRAVRFYTDKPVPDGVLEKILDAGRWAPTAANGQGLEFVVVKNEESRGKIAKLVQEVWEMTGKCSTNWWRYVVGMLMELGDPNALCLVWGLSPEKSPPQRLYNAPVMVIVTSDEDKRETTVYSSTTYYSMASDGAFCAIQNMMLAAYALGVGSVPLTFFDPTRIRYWFGIPSTMGVAAIVLLGYPTEWPKEPGGGFAGAKGIYPRRPLEDMVHYEKFDEDKWEKYRAMDPFVYRLPREEMIRRARKLGGFLPGDKD